MYSMHDKRGIRSGVHGDDFLVNDQLSQLMWMRAAVARKKGAGGKNAAKEEVRTAEPFLICRIGKREVCFQYNSKGVGSNEKCERLHSCSICAKAAPHQDCEAN